MCEFLSNLVFFSIVILVQPYTSVLFSAYWKHQLFSCRFQLTVEVFDYLDAELRLAETGEKQNPPLSFRPLKGNPSFFLRLLWPADIIYSCSKARNCWRESQSETLFLSQAVTKKRLPEFSLEHTHFLFWPNLLELKRKCMQLEVIKMISFSVTTMIMLLLAMGGRMW